MDMPDVIDALAGILPGSPLDAIRARRPQARAQAQATHDALFAPADPGEVSLVERLAVAAFVIGLHGEPEVTAFHAAALAGAGAPPTLQAAVAEAAAAGRTAGPFGHYPAGPLSREDAAGQGWQAGAVLAETLGPRLAAAFGHAHMLVFHPRDADAVSLQALLDAGWSTTGIVTLSQIVAFLSFQVRTIRGLATLAAS
ncbi:MAG: hypothetical protein JWP04_3710, partial [Belnapia sp.]|nr:hypothetical protein [Belnapia sp.]